MIKEKQMNTSNQLVVLKCWIMLDIPIPAGTQSFLFDSNENFRQDSAGWAFN